MNKKTLKALGGILIGALCGGVAGPAAATNQDGTPIWVQGDSAGRNLADYIAVTSIHSIDFMPSLPGTEIFGIENSSCNVIDVGSTKVKVRIKEFLKLDSGIDGTPVMKAKAPLLLETGAFPDPFNPVNQTNGSLDFDYFSGDDYLTSQIQQRTNDSSSSQNNFLCDLVWDNAFFSVHRVTTGNPSVGATEGILLAEGVSFSYKNKTSGGKFRVGKYVVAGYNLSADAGAIGKRNFNKVFKQKGADGFSINREYSAVGPLHTDPFAHVLRVASEKHVGGDSLSIKIKYFDAFTGALVGSPFTVLQED